MDFVDRLQRAGVRLWVDEGRLRVRTTHGDLRSEDLSSLRLLKTRIATLLLDLQSDQLTPGQTAARSINMAPLTYRQESLWKLMKIDRTGASRLVNSMLRLKGQFDLEALEKSFRTVIGRHEALRTTIIERTGQPFQSIAPRAVFSLEVVHLPSTPNECGCDIRDVQNILHSFVTTALKIPGEPLFQGKLVSLSREESVLAVVAHHLITDAISMALFWSELWHLYPEFAHGAAPDLPKVEMQCGDYAIWQRSEYFPWKADYWQSPTNDIPRILFPSDYPTPRSRTGIGAFETLTLTPLSTQSLHDLASRQNVTLGMVVLTLYAALVIHECRQYEFVLPFQVSGRLYPHHINMMGYFAHPLLLRIRATATDSFAQLLTRVSEEFLQAQGHSDCGKLLALTPDLFSGGLFQWSSYMDFVGDQSLNDIRNEAGGAFTAEPFQLAFDIEKSTELVEQDIMLSLFESKTGIGGFAAYREDLFTRNTVRQIFSRFESLCEFSNKHTHDPLSTFRPH